MSIDISLISLGVAIAAALAAVFGAIVPWWSSRNEKLLNQAVLSLERAYAALTRNAADGAAPQADRVNWLTAARHIERYKAIKGRIMLSKIHALLCEENEEYWRHQFYLCLKPIEKTLDYYGKVGSSTSSPAEAATVVHHFSEWGPTKSDPIASVDINALVDDRPNMIKRFLALQFYIQHHNQNIEDNAAKRQDGSGGLAACPLVWRLTVCTAPLSPCYARILPIR